MFSFKSYNSEEEDIVRIATEMRQGSAEAFRILYAKYQTKIYRFCFKLLGDETIAKDAFQETFIRLYEHRKEYNGGNFVAWLFTISRRVCLNQLRSKKEYETFDEDIFNVESFEENTNDIGIKEQLNHAISLLPLTFREAFILKEYNDLSYHEIAEILGIDISLAKIRVFRSRQILRKLLKPLHKELYES